MSYGLAHRLGIAIGVLALTGMACDRATEPPPVVASVEIGPVQTTLQSLGQTVTLHAVAKAADGQLISGKSFVWQSQTPTIVTVSAGVVTAVANGTGTVTATTDGVTGNATVNVEQVLVSIEVSPATVFMKSFGETAQLSATLKDARDNALTTSETVLWSSTNAPAAFVSDAGLVTAQGNGATTVRARVRNVVGSAQVDVSQTPANLVFAAQPHAIQPDVPLAAVRLAITDARNNVMPTATNSVSIALGANSTGATLSGLKTAAPSAGEATFANLSVDRLGTAYTLVATAPQLAAATSVPFDVITARARIDSLKLDSPVLPLGGLSLWYTAWLVNASAAPLSPAGVQAWLEQGGTQHAAGGALVSCGGSGVMIRGPCQFRFNISAAPSNFSPGAATAQFDLFEAFDTLHTLRVPLTLETFVPPPTPNARIDEITLASTELVIDGASVTATARITNSDATSVSQVGLQGWITQGSASRAAGGTLVRCPGTDGVLPPGSCTLQTSVRARNAGGGTGTLVPGPATAVFELNWPYGVIATYMVPITLIN
jgi:hypothetical protein